MIGAPAAAQPEVPPSRSPAATTMHAGAERIARAFADAGGAATAGAAPAVEELAAKARP